MNRTEKVHTYGFRKVKGVFGALALTTMVSMTLPQIASADTIDDIAEDDADLIEDVAEDAVYEEVITDVEEDVAEVEAPVEVYEEPVEVYEAPAEVVEEVYEEVVEEVVEEVYEEIVEEAAPEVTEPVVEEAPAEEMTEDIVEEVYEEVTEEIVEEDVAAEEVVTDEVAEEVISEDVVEDAPAEDAIEDSVDEVIEDEVSEDVIEDAPVEDVIEDTVDEIVEEEEVVEEVLVEDEAEVEYEMFALQANTLSDDPIHKDNLDELRADQTYDSAIQEEISYQLINKHRGENGKAHIHMNDDLNTFAQLRAADMAIHDYYAHDRPEELGGWNVRTQYNEFMDATSGMTVGENIVLLSASAHQFDTVEDILGGRYTYRDIVMDDDGNPVRNENGGLTFVDKATSIAERAFSGWVNSPAHNENMLRDDLTAMGIGFHAVLNEVGNVWNIYAVQTISLSNSDIETTQNDNFIEKDLDDIDNPLADDEEVAPPAPEEPTEPEDGDDDNEDEQPSEPEDGDDNAGTDDPTDPSNNGDDEEDTEPSEPTEPEDGNDDGEDEDVENPVTDDPTDPGNNAGEGDEEQPSEPSTPEDGDDNTGTDDPTDPSNNGDDEDVDGDNDEDIVDPDTPVDNENDETSEEEDNTEDSDVDDADDAEDTDDEENEEDPIEKPIEGDGEGQGTNIKVYDEDGNQVHPSDPRYHELLEKQLAEEAAQEGEDDEAVDEDGDVIEKPEQPEDSETPADSQEDIGTDAGSTETPVVEDNGNVTGDTEISHDTEVEMLPKTGLASDSKALLATVLAFLGSMAIFARRK